MTIQSTAPAWFGKIPSAGDFLAHRFPHALQLYWDQWIRAGLADMKQHLPENWQSRFAQGAIWNFVIRPGADTGMAQIGVFAPSADRVGRIYPLCISHIGPVSALRTLETQGTEEMEGVGVFFSALGEAVRAVFRQHLSPADLENRLRSIPSPFAGHTGAGDITRILNGGSVSPPFSGGAAGLPRFRLQASLAQDMDFSLWWTSTIVRQDYREVTHRGDLSPGLFQDLYREAFQPCGQFTS